VFVEKGSIGCVVSLNKLSLKNWPAYTYIDWHLVRSSFKKHTQLMIMATNKLGKVWIKVREMAYLAQWSSQVWYHWQTCRKRGVRPFMGVALHENIYICIHGGSVISKLYQHVRCITTTTCRHANGSSIANLSGDSNPCQEVLSAFYPTRYSVHRRHKWRKR